MPEQPSAAFISYCRDDSEFALRLAQDLKAAGARVWLDQLDIVPGQHWDNAIEDALLEAAQMLIVLSPASARSNNVRDEISYALEQGKIIIPVLYMDCAVPLRLQRMQRIDFRADYARGLASLLHNLHVANPNQAVLDKAAEGDAHRHAAWQAREIEARRLQNIDNVHQRDEVEPIAFQPESPQPASKRSNLMLTLILCGAAVIVIAVAFFALRQKRGSPTVEVKALPAPTPQPPVNVTRDQGAETSLGVAYSIDPPSNIRDAPSAASTIVCSVSAHQPIPLLSMERNWYKTNVCGTTGYIYRDQVKFAIR